MNSVEEIEALIPPTLYKIRTDARISQEELADRLGISRNTVRNYETGAARPSLLQSLAWCDACGFSVDEYTDIVTGRKKESSPARAALHRIIDSLPDSIVNRLAEVAKTELKKMED